MILSIINVIKSRVVVAHVLQPRKIGDEEGEPHRQCQLQCEGFPSVVFS